MSTINCEDIGQTSEILRRSTPVSQRVCVLCTAQRASECRQAIGEEEMHCGGGGRARHGQNRSTW